MTVERVGQTGAGEWRAEIVGRGLVLALADQQVRLHPQWLRDRSTEPGQIEETNRQRLFTPRDMPVDLAVTACVLDGDVLTVGFSDGHVAHFDAKLIARRAGMMPDDEEPPAPEPWLHPIDPFPYVDWAAFGTSVDDEDTDGVLAGLRSFYRHGYVVLRNTPTEAGTLVSVAERFGYVVGTNFGPTFDVRTEHEPTDLAYTSIELLAHNDQPYRQPVPGIQMLHCLCNDAPGGDSTLVDGLVAARVLAEGDPDAHTALRDIEIEYRYDMGSDTVVDRGHVLEYDRHDRFTSMRYNTKLDVPVVRAGDGTDTDLDAWYRGRRWLTDWLNDPQHQVTFRLEPGDVMFMDNHRVLHGRTAFDPSVGSRHLQGCYIEHDGPDTMYRLAVRRARLAT